MRVGSAEGLVDFEVASTTNQIEGGINAQLRLLLRHHRGLPEEHMRRAVEWFLYLRGEDPQAAHQFIQQHHYRPQPKNVYPFMTYTPNMRKPLAFGCLAA